MSLTLVSSSDDRALAIRDHLLTVVRERGRLQRRGDWAGDMAMPKVSFGTVPRGSLHGHNG